MSGRSAVAVAVVAASLVVLVGFALVELGSGRRHWSERQAASVRVAAWVAAVAGSDDEAAVVTAGEFGALERAGYDYRLTRTGLEPGAGEQLVARPAFASGSTAAALESPVTATVRLPRSRWTLEVAPRRGWAPVGPSSSQRALVLIAALVAAVVAHDVARRPARLRREIELREERLKEVRKRLSEEVARREAAEDLQIQEAYRDALTGLPNRANLVDRLGRAMERARRQPGYVLAVVFLDLDRFKKVNDSLGHAAGDQLLGAAARRFESCVRPQDLVSRLGGDEFAMLLFDIGEEAAAMTTAKRVVDAFVEPFTVDGQEVFVTVSVGVAVSGSGYDRPEELLREADIALHQAKAQGRGRAVRVDAEARDLAASVLRLDSDLRRAIEREEFELRFQPIVSLATGHLAGFEVLVRWAHPVEGVVPPAAFLDLAEETGLIVAIDRWVLASACQQARAWLDRLPADAPFYLSVNLSGRDLHQPDLAEFVAGALRRSALPSGVIRLEVTESVVLGNVAATAELVEALHRLGVPLLLDDFGTGYSSLSYLHRFRFEYLKIDRSFVRRLGPGGPDAPIVRAIVRLAEELGLGTIGEGVESVEEARRLRDLGCGFGQGYAFSRPVEAAAAEALLTGRRRWDLEAIAAERGSG